MTILIPPKPDMYGTNKPEQPAVVPLFKPQNELLYKPVVIQDSPGSDAVPNLLAAN